MLILTRKVDEAIQIGEHINIKVVSIEGNKVKLGISAPKNVSVVREEILDAVKKENINAGNVKNLDIDFKLLE